MGNNCLNCLKNRQTMPDISNNTYRSTNISYEIQEEIRYRLPFMYKHLSGRFYNTDERLFQGEDVALNLW